MLFYGNKGFLPSQNHPEWYDENGMLIKPWYDLPLTEGGWLEPEITVDKYYNGNPGDFTAFIYDGISSKDLGIIRVSTGSDYSFDLHPTINNVTVEVPGGNGYYFFGSNYKDKPLKLNIAFDNLTEQQLRRIANIFSPRNELKDFYYVNHPYKVWRVKISAPIVLNAICFDEGPTHRLYKGTGEISLQAFAPFARERMKYLDQYVAEFKQLAKRYGLLEEEAETWVKEWEAASRLLWNKTDPNGYFDYDSVVSENFPSNSLFCPGVYHCWNAGDFETDYMLYFYDDTQLQRKKNNPSYTINSNKTFSFRIRGSLLPGGNDIGEYKIKDLVLVEGDAGFRVNTKLNLIEGIDENGEITGSVYNQYKTCGEYFKLPQGESWIIIDSYDSEWYRSKTLENIDKNKVPISGYYQRTWADVIKNDWGKIKQDFTWGSLLNGKEEKSEGQVLVQVPILWVRNYDLLSELKGDEFDCEYHDLYL